MLKWKVTVAIPLTTDNFSINLAKGGVEKWVETVEARSYTIEDGALMFEGFVATYASGRWIKVVLVS